MKKTKMLLAFVVAIVLVCTSLLAVACQKNCTVTLYDGATGEKVGEVKTKANMPLVSIDIDGYLLDGKVLYYSQDDYTAAQNADADVTEFVVGETLVDKDISLYANWIKLALDTGTGYTYRTYAGNIPTYWNPLDYKDADASDMINYGSSSFYEFDYKLDASGNIIPGQFIIRPMMASGDPIDVTAEYANTGLTLNGWTVDKGWNINSAATLEVPDGEGGTETIEIEADVARAWRIPLRNNLKWDDGTAIKASDFVETMKILLDPAYKNYRADSYYAGDTIIYNAKNYFYQGSKVWQDNVDSAQIPEFERADLVKGSDGTYTLGGDPVKLNTKTKMNWLGGTLPQAIAAYSGTYLDAEAGAALLALANDAGDIAITDEVIALLETMITAYPAWGETTDEIVCYMVHEATYPTLDFNKVGVMADDANNTLTIIFEKAFNADNNLYNWAYSMGSFPLVKKDVYMANLKAPTGGSTLYTSTYCTSPATSPSYGPYKLVSLQLGKQYIWEKNPNWVGYTLDYNEGKYQTTRIVCDMIDNWDTAWMLFQKGQLAAVSIDPKIADEYKTSSQAYFTPNDYVGSLQVQSSPTTRVVNPDDGNANELLLNEKFRKAISLGFDRAEYVATCTTSSKAGFGLFGPIHYYDVQNGKVYRDEDVAKRVICDVYGVNVADYKDLDAAYEAVTGYNLQMARDLVKEAIAEELAKGTIKSTDTKLELTVGSSEDNEAARRPYNFLKKALDAILVGSSLEGKLTLSYDGTHNSSNDAFATDFISGQYEFVFAGWQGAAWNPFWFLTAYLSESNRYALGWKPEEVTVTITVENYDFGDGSHTATLNLMEWYDCINGNSGAPYNMGAGIAEMSDRLIIAAEIEKQILESYFSIPYAYSFGAAIRSYKVKAVSNDYHTFMGWGGVQYYTYNYNDAEWAAYVASQGGTLDYKK